MLESRSSASRRPKQWAFQKKAYFGTRIQVSGAILLGYSWAAIDFPGHVITMKRSIPRQKPYQPENQIGDSDTKNPNLNASFTLVRLSLPPAARVLPCWGHLTEDRYLGAHPGSLPVALWLGPTWRMCGGTTGPCACSYALGPAAV